MFVCFYFCYSRHGSEGTGGALFIEQHTGSIHLVHCFFHNNSAGGPGGALQSAKLAGLVENCIFEQNRAYQGGAMYGLSAGNKLILQNCSFENNTAAFLGGALFFSHISMALINCTFVGNTSPTAGAMYCEGEANEFTVVQCKIKESNFQGKFMQDGKFESAVDVHGGKLAINNSVFDNNIGSGLNIRNTRALLCRCYFSNNSGADGGAITTQDSKCVLVITNTSFVRNRGRWADAIFSKSQMTLIQNCQFRSKPTGGEIHVIVIQARKSAKLRISGCVFWKSEPQYQGLVALRSSAGVSINVTLFLWETSIQSSDNEILPVDHTKFSKIVVVNSVHVTKVFSQFASGMYWTGQKKPASEGLRICVC